jgi:CheY-like chemotaxis protein
MSKILVVDDSAANRLVLTGHLEAAGFKVVEATSGESALALLMRETIDLAVLDVLMPGMDGYETCRRMRADPAMAETPVLFLTALGDRDAAPMKAAGGNGILGKPFQRGELLRRISELLPASRE